MRPLEQHNSSMVEQLVSCEELIKGSKWSGLDALASRGFRHVLPPEY